MSDFIFSRKRMEEGVLAEEISRIYLDGDRPGIKEFHGPWGSLAVSRNLYNGFKTYETERYIITVIGGPVLTFRDNLFLRDETSDEGTQAVFERWLAGEMKWDEDLSGPFVVFSVHKMTGDVHCITDLMSFIPVYIYKENGNIMLSTHVDALAGVCGEAENIDPVSEADFILHGVVTYPYTVYKNIRQAAPASVHEIHGETDRYTEQHYWLPEEKTAFSSIHEAAVTVRQALHRYVVEVTRGMDHIAQFISAGEDSRLLSGLLPKEKIRDAFVFLDSMNREGKIAKKAAEAYGARFHVKFRKKTHYIDMLPVCHELVGGGAQYHHVHTYLFHKTCKLAEYPAVFGGLFSDALLKGARIRKIRGSTRLPFLPDLKSKHYSPANPLKHDVFSPEVLAEIEKRRRDHFNYVKTFRHESAGEWFELWPASMNMNISNIYGNRRLFKSYEPFMSKDIVKVSASVPQKWKMNRKLFLAVAKPLLEPAKWLMHGDGRFPYFPWYVNIWIQFFYWLWEELLKKLKVINGNQGSWADWDAVFQSKAWKQTLHLYKDGINRLDEVFIEKDPEKLMERFDLLKKLNLIQVLYSLSDNRRKTGDAAGGKKVNGQ